MTFKNIDKTMASDMVKAMLAKGHDMEVLNALAYMTSASGEMFAYLSERVQNRREIVDLKNDTALKQKLATLLNANDKAGEILAKRAASAVALVTGGEITEIPGVGMVITVKNDNGESPSKLN